MAYRYFDADGPANINDPKEERALATVWTWLSAWAKADGIRPVDYIRVRGPNTWIDLTEKDNYEWTFINIAEGELRAFVLHPKEFGTAFKWVTAHEYGHHRGWNTSNNLKDALDWTSDECQDYADDFAAKTTGLTHAQARDLVHKYAPSVHWTDTVGAEKDKRKEQCKTKTRSKRSTRKAIPTVLSTLSKCDTGRIRRP